MVSRANRMQLLVDLAEQEMDRAIQTLKEIQNQRDYVQLQLNDLKAYLEEYVAKISTSGQSFMPIQLQTTHAFVEKLKQAILSQTQQVESLTETVRAAEQQWLEKRVRFNALQKVQQKLSRNEKVALDRIEQKWLDDLAAQNFIKNGGK